MWQRLIIFGIVSLFYSCQNSEAYYAFREMKKAEWSKDDTLYFYVDTLSVEKGRKYNISVELGHNAGYPYRNLWLYVADNIYDTAFTINPRQYMLADEFGKWYGSGFGAVYQISLPYEEGVEFGGGRNYLFRVVHGMRDEPLEGIEKIGIKIERTD